MEAQARDAECSATLPLLPSHRVDLPRDCLLSRHLLLTHTLHPSQAAGSAPYSLDVLLAVLRLYLVFPDTSKPGVVAACLATALQRLPESHFSLCLHLVPEALLSDADVSHLVTLHGHLDGCRWKDAWATAAANARTSTPSFSAAIRAYVGSTLSCVYRSMPVAVAQEALNFGGDDAGLHAWLGKESGWAIQDGLTAPRTDGNDPRPVAAGGAAETIPYAKLISLLSTASQ